MAAIALSKLVKEMDLREEDCYIYFDRQNQQIIHISDEDMDIAKANSPVETFPDWHMEQIQTARNVLSSGPKRYLELPTHPESFEYEAMCKFRNQVNDEKIRLEIKNAISGSGAYRKFDECIQQYGLEQDWFAFRQNVLKTIAITWCQSHQFDFHDDIEDSL